VSAGVCSGMGAIKAPRAAIGMLIADVDKSAGDSREIRLAG